MSASLRPCGSCGHHVRTDETRCPFCNADLSLLHHLPVMRAPFSDERPAPMYGGPPLESPRFWIPILIGLAIGGAVAAWMLR